MIISQKFNSINDIDLEFVPSLELLLSHKIPHFQSLINYEENAPQDIGFAYYLFFSNKTNSPIGFAQLELKNEKPIKKSLMAKLLKKDPVENQFEKSVEWLICGTNEDGIIFDPRYISNFTDGAQKVITEFQNRKDIQSQSIYFSDSYSKIENLSHCIKHSDKIVPDVLVKNQSSYQEFFLSLEDDLQRAIKENWKKVQKELKLEMGDYQSFKHTFQYKAEGPAQYKELKNHPKLKKYIKEDNTTYFLTLESKKRLSLLVILIAGNNGNSFYDTLYQDETISDIMVHQLSLMKFYECEEFNNLYFLGDPDQADHLFSIGFTKKKIAHILINKVKP